MSALDIEQLREQILLATDLDEKLFQPKVKTAQEAVLDFENDNYGIESSFNSRLAGSKSRDTKSVKTITIPLAKIEALLDQIFGQADTIPSEIARKAVTWLIQVPVRGLFDRLEELTRALAQERGIELNIFRSGDDVKVDCRALDLLFGNFLEWAKTVLVQREEADLLEKSAGFPRAVTLSMSAQLLEDKSILIEIADDGRGEGVELSCLKDSVERILGGKVWSLSKLGRGTNISVCLPQAGVALAPVRSFGYFSSPEKEKDVVKSLRVLLGNLPDLRQLSLDCPLLVDLQSLDYLKNLIGHSAAVHKLVVVDDLSPQQIADFALGREGARHFISYKAKWSGIYLKPTLKKLSGDLTWGLSPYLLANTRVQSFLIKNNSDKIKILEDLAAFADQLKCFSALGDIVCSVADEMISNSIFDAPRDGLGRSKYSHLAKTEDLALKPHEMTSIRYASDRKFIAISVEDSFGALTWDMVASSIRKGYSVDAEATYEQVQEAGTGLFRVFDRSHCLVVNSRPGNRTEVISLIALDRSFQEYIQEGKCFSFFSTV